MVIIWIQGYVEPHSHANLVVSTNGSGAVQSNWTLYICYENIFQVNNPFANEMGSTMHFILLWFVYYLFFKFKKKNPVFHSSIQII